MNNKYINLNTFPIYQLVTLNYVYIFLKSFINVLISTLIYRNLNAVTGSLLYGSFLKLDVWIKSSSLDFNFVW